MEKKPSDEELVRDRWPDLTVGDLVGGRISICSGRDCLAQGVPSEAWAAAAAFTREQKWWDA